MPDPIVTDTSNNTLATDVVDPNAPKVEEKVVDPNAPKDAPKTELSAEEKAAADAKVKADADKAAAAKVEEDRRAKLTDEQRKAEDKAKADAEEKRKLNFGAPEKYEFKKADGKPAPDAELATELSNVAKEFDLSQAAAQRVYDLGQKLVDKHVGTLQAQIEQTRNDWATQTKADKEVGGDQIDANLAVARKAMELGTPELKKVLNETGLGNHPEIVRWMYRVGKTLKQDEHISGNRSTENRDARSYYPNSNMNP